jgi:predicted GNAT superfamily acetyltransferase
MAASEATTIRHCKALQEFRQCVELQKTVWGWDDEDLIPTRFFVVARKIEGQIIGAFDASDKMVGFCLAVPAFHGPARYLHSHMLAVLLEFRRAGVGRRLKLEQRRDALERGIRLIEWTFDPLEWKNAVFNLNRLGAIARRYVPNQYGISSSPLHRGLPTDRLIAEWWLDSPRVSACVEGRELGIAAERGRVTFPLDALDHSWSAGRSAADVQTGLRTQLQDAFARGLSATGVEVTGRTASYLLNPFEIKREAHLS